MKLIPQSKFATSGVQTTLEELVNARMDFIKNVVYRIGDTTEYCTPAHTFNGWACDCYLLVRRRGNQFFVHPEIPGPVPIRADDLGEIIGAIQ
jgi:hypothetical protein